MTTHPDHEELPATPRTTLRYIRPTDEAEFIERAQASVRLHYPYAGSPQTPEAFQQMMLRYDRPDNVGLLVCDRADGSIAGLINLNNIVWGRFQCASLGYNAFVPAAGRGFMTEGLGLVIKHAFETMGLHRLEANIQPGNERSIALVKRHGFRLEGLSPDFLFINEAWRDHERWALTTEMLSP